MRDLGFVFQISHGYPEWVQVTKQTGPYGLSTFKINKHCLRIEQSLLLQQPVKRLTCVSFKTMSIQRINLFHDLSPKPKTCKRLPVCLSTYCINTCVLYVCKLRPLILNCMKFNPHVLLFGDFQTKGSFRSCNFPFRTSAKTKPSYQTLCILLIACLQYTLPVLFSALYPVTLAPIGRAS